MVAELRGSMNVGIFAWLSGWNIPDDWSFDEYNNDPATEDRELDCIVQRSLPLKRPQLNEIFPLS
jgi:hypothetical protein